MNIRTLASGAYAEAAPAKPAALLIGSEQAYRNLWSSSVGNVQAPPVDFEKEIVVLLLAGSKPTGGYVVEPKGVSVDGDTLVVDAAIKAPAAGTIVTQAFTSPWAAIAVTKADVKQVRWTP